MSELSYFPGALNREDYAQKIAALFSEHLGKNGLRLTTPRRKILNCLLKADKHLNQEEIYKSLRPQGIGRATVFRTLKMLEDSNLLGRISGISGPPKFEVHFERPHHDHLVCISCGSIQEIQCPKIEKIQEKACRKIGFEVRWHRHEIFGFCPQCAKRRKQT